MLGFPGESREEMEMTLNYALKNKFSDARFFSVVVYPRTTLMEIAKKVYPNFDFNEWEFSSLYYWAEIPFYTKATGVDLHKIRLNAHQRFYLRPKIIFSLFWHFPKNFSLIRRISSVLKFWFVRRLWKLKKSC